MKSVLRIAMLVLLAVGVVACGDDDNMPATVAEAAANDDRLTTLVAALEATGLDEALAGEGPFTVFAPTDDAFDLLPAGLIDLGAPAPATAGGSGRPSAALTPNEVADVLRYHVLPEELDAAGVIASETLTTLGDGEIDVQVIDGTVVLDGRVQVTSTNIRTGNGIIHVIDAVLIDGAFPGTLVDAVVASPRFSTLKDAVVAEGLATTLAGDNGGDGYTVLAPTNAAFAALPDGLIGDLVTDGLLDDVLLYHVVPLTALEATVVTLDEAPTAAGENIDVEFEDGTVVLDGRVQVISTDIEAENGVIHVIDAVLVPGAFPGTIVDVLVASPRFSTLVDAVVAEDLAGTLAGDNGGNGFTVFAPTNDGFDRLPDGLVADVAAADLLTDVLLYHVLGAEVDSEAAIGAATGGGAVATLAPTGSGNFLALAVDVDADDDLFLDGRTEVTYTDIETENGVIHVLDSVLVPGVDFPGTLVEALSAYPRFDSLVEAVVSEGLAGAVTGVTVFAPTNDAFDAVTGLNGNTLADVLAYHLLGTEKDSGSLGAVETTALGETISIAVNGDVVINGSSTVIFTDIGAEDGIIHVIDEVLVPPAP